MIVHLTRSDEFAVLALDRPEALNALSFATLRELDSVEELRKAVSNTEIEMITLALRRPRHFPPQAPLSIPPWPPPSCLASAGPAAMIASAVTAATNSLAITEEPVIRRSNLARRGNRGDRRF